MKKNKKKARPSDDSSFSESEDSQTAESHQSQIQAILKKNQIQQNNTMKRMAPKKTSTKKEKELLKMVYADDDSQDSDDCVWDQPTAENLALYLKQQKFRSKKAFLDKKTLNFKYLQGLVKSGDYWCLGRVMFLMKKFLSKELSEIYFSSIKYKLNLQKQILILERIKLPAREVRPTEIRLPPKDQEAHWRQGYAIAEMVEFYDLLKDQNLLMRSIKDFRMMILPIFYLLHGEAYDSDDPLTMSSYIVNPSKSQCNIVCLKCRVNKCNTSCHEFLYHNTQYDKAKKSYEPTDITVNTRGTPFNSLHYLTSHGYYGLVPKYDDEGQIMKWERQHIGTLINGQSIEPKITSEQTEKYGQVEVSTGQKRSHSQAYEMKIQQVAKNFNYADYDFSSDDEDNLKQFENYPKKNQKKS